jgi:energy-coupling factor transport system substrate-specific component
MKMSGPFHMMFLCLCVALNVGVGALIGALKLPFFLDSTGTMLAAALGGWLYGSLCGLISVSVSSVMVAPTAWAYGGTTVVIAVVTSLLAKYGFLRSVIGTVIGGIILGIAAALASVPITVFLGGVTMIGTDAVTALFKAMGNTLVKSVVLSGLSTDPVDKVVTSLVAFSILRSLPRRIFYRFPRGEYFVYKEHLTGSEPEK